jgi:hypothetical protein
MRSDLASDAGFQALERPHALPKPTYTLVAYGLHTLQSVQTVGKLCRALSLGLEDDQLGVARRLRRRFQQYASPISPRMKPATLIWSQEACPCAASQS